MCSHEADRGESRSNQFSGKHAEQEDLLEHRTSLLLSDHTHDHRVHDQENESQQDLKISLLSFSDLFVQDKVCDQAETRRHQLCLGKRTEIAKDPVSHHDHKEREQERLTVRDLVREMESVPDEGHHAAA